MKKLLQKAFIFPLIVTIAIAAVVYKIKSRVPLEHVDSQFPEKVVKVITVKKLPFRSRATAYGYVEPSVLLKYKAEVSGKISYIHPELKQGGSLHAGTVVLRIEPTTFEFSLDQSEAGLASTQSSLEQLEVEEKSTRQLLGIAQRNLNVGQKELDRIRAIWEKRLIARSALDAEEQKLLGLRQQVVDLQGQLSTYASRKAAILAQIKQSETQVDESKDTLGRTEIRLPFDARIGIVAVEQDEFVAAGSHLFDALGTDSVEINAQLPVKYFRPLVRSMKMESPDLQNPANLQKLLSNWDLEVRVRRVGDTSDTIWYGKLVRIGESIDPVRDTVSLIVIVDKPYKGVIPGKRPPLLKGMYTSIEFISKANPILVIPRKVIHQGRVYVVSAKNTLAIRPIKTSSEQGQLAVVESGLEEGDQIIITDVVPVIEGLPLKLIQATDYEEDLRILAIGEE